MLDGMIRSWGRARSPVAAIDLRAAEPWLRVAAVDVLDRWLHLPLNQALVDAERGVARAYAARTLERAGPETMSWPMLCA